MADELRKAAIAVLARWDSPQWEWSVQSPTADLMQALRAALAAPEPKICRDDGRCQYAIDHGAEGLGHCPKGRCAMPTPEPSQIQRDRMEARFANRGKTAPSADFDLPSASDDFLATEPSREPTQEQVDAWRKQASDQASIDAYKYNDATSHSKHYWDTYAYQIAALAYAAGFKAGSGT
jgi:hypothetical protein